jgi:hypothetical protein
MVADFEDVTVLTVARGHRSGGRSQQHAVHMQGKFVSTPDEALIMWTFRGRLRFVYSCDLRQARSVAA